APSEQAAGRGEKKGANGPRASGVANDFNNLLSVISGHSELLAMSLLADSPGLDSVGQSQIGRAAERGAALIRHLLAFSRQQVIELQVFDLNVLVADTEKILRRLIGENVPLITILQPGMSQVRDPASSTKSS